MLPAPQRQGGIGKKNTAEPAPPNTVVFCNTFPPIAAEERTFRIGSSVPTAVMPGHSVPHSFGTWIATSLQEGRGYSLGVCS
jgi:hypothetical protein